MNAARPHLLGSSDAGSLLGVGRESPLFLFLRLTNQLPVESEKDKERIYALRAGKLAEDALIRPLAEESYDVKLIRYPVVELPGEKRIGVSIDFVHDTPQFREGRGIEIAELKLTGSVALWGPAGSREIPVSVMLQVLMQMAVLRARFPDPAFSILASVYTCFVPGFEVKRYRIPEDPEAQSKLLDRARAVLDNCDKGIRPDPRDEIESRIAILAKKGKKVILTPEQVALAREIASMQAEEKKLTAGIKERRNVLVPMLGDATELYDEHGQEVGTYRANNEFDETGFRIAHPELIAQCSKPAPLDKDKIKEQIGKGAYESFLRQPTNPSSQTRQLRLKEAE